MTIRTRLVLDLYDDDGEWELFYLPTAERLEKRAGRDWY